jgi:hypothetical protein
MAFFLSIVPMQPPSDILGLDQSNRPRLSFNLQAYSRTLPDFPGCVASILQSNVPSLGTLNSSIFIGPLASIPSQSGDDGPYISIRDTGGGPPSISQIGITTHFSTCQIVVIAADYSIAKARAGDVYSACVKFNVEVTPI